MAIERANTHPVWDPPWAAGGVQERYHAQIELGQELVRYGADLLLRAIQSAPDTVSHHVVLSVLFRQELAAFEGAMLALEAAAIGAANVHARGQMEARWGLTLALADPDKWGRHIYVASLRQQRFHLASLQAPRSTQSTKRPVSSSRKAEVTPLAVAKTGPVLWMALTRFSPAPSTSPFRPASTRSMRRFWATIRRGITTGPPKARPPVIHSAARHSSRGEGRV